jgi:nitrite reductase/ring-hydroxylating ferredoxin subunit
MAGGPLEDGILTCPHHGFRYALESGECLTAPQVQLQPHPVRVRGGEIEVRLGAGPQGAR